MHVVADRVFCVIPTGCKALVSTVNAVGALLAFTAVVICKVSMLPITAVVLCLCGWYIL